MWHNFSQYLITTRDKGRVSVVQEGDRERERELVSELFQWELILTFKTWTPSHTIHRNASTTIHRLLEQPDRRQWQRAAWRSVTSFRRRVENALEHQKYLKIHRIHLGNWCSTRNGFKLNSIYICKINCSIAILKFSNTKKYYFFMFV